MLDTQIIKIEDINNPQNEMQKIKAAADILKNGGLVCIPTETVYGLAANALDKSAVANIFKAKGRPQDNPLIVHISDIDMLAELASAVPKSAARLAESFWPGPLTIILPKSDIIPDVTSAGMQTVAVRMPSNKIACEIISAAGLPLAAPSANLSGSPSPTSAKHCVDDMLGRVDAIVDGGECLFGLESTVVSLAGEKPRLLRPGAVTLEQLKEVLGKVEVDNAVLNKMAENEQAASPGMKYKHYAPKAKVVIIKSTLEKYADFVNRQGDVWAMCFDGEQAKLNKPYVTYGHKSNPSEQANRLFEVLRSLDEKGAKLVYARCPDTNGIGLAVYNRLLRAAAFEIINLQ
ncbi:MAG TPA: threonylcarbamoyl-AMP synthase [Ruminococcaceae bacterium]|mgnify:CR=1 FL=1|nr:threonylcarbamoyl-AMP synthase [Oscillospiraceae bacterium]